jgi:hypothetical protein
MSLPFFATLSPTVLQNPGDAGPWVALPPNVSNPFFIHVGEPPTNGAGVGAAQVQISNDPNDGAPFTCFNSQNLTGPGVGDGFYLAPGPRFARLLLGPTHPAGLPITGNINSNG